jgi:hypothetical protein
MESLLFLMIPICLL